DLLMQEEAREQRHADVANRSGRQHVSQVGKRESGKIVGKKQDQQQDSDRHPGCEDGLDEDVPIAKGDFTEVSHAALKADVTGRAENHDPSQSCELAKGHSKPFSMVEWRLSNCESGGNGNCESVVYGRGVLVGSKQVEELGCPPGSRTPIC